MEMIYICLLRKRTYTCTSELLLKLYRNCLLKILLNQRMISTLFVAYSDLLRSHKLLKLKYSDMVFNSVYIHKSVYYIV